jgi:hypothetical protein
MPPRTKLTISRARVRSKVAECHFFLRQMQEHEQVEDFRFVLSAFLSALKSVEYLTRPYQKEISNRLCEPRTERAELDYLLSARDLEVHREGVKTVREITAYRKIRYLGPGRFQTLKANSSRVQFVNSRLRFRREQGRKIDAVTFNYVWHFDDYPVRDAVDVCRAALEVLEGIVKERCGVVVVGSLLG